jgi:hypothetical protein
MDLFFDLSQSTRKDIFCFDDTSTRALFEHIRVFAPKSNKDFYDISDYGLSLLPVGAIPFRLIQNPFASWERCQNKPEFRKGNILKRIPNGSFKKSLKPDIAYIVDGFRAEGAYAEVWTLVAYRNHSAVIKMIEFDEFDWFELVIQAYLHEKCHAYEYIEVPRILFLQRSKSMGTDACMERAKGVPICSLKGIRLLVAIAHAMKALYQLQEDLCFMHRDLSGQNIYYEPSEHLITFIDFGMSWLNPTKHKIPWQIAEDTFYDWRTENKMNRSLDASTLIAHASLQDAWFATLHNQMKRDYKQAIQKSNNTLAKQKLSPPRKKDTQYTTIRKGSWCVGNELEPWNAETSSGDGPHWWLFNMSSFEVDQWTPENVLKRVLRKLPLDHWFALRRHWKDTFDKIMPKDVRILLDDGTEGILEKLVQRTCRIRVGNAIRHVPPNKCRQTCRITI